MGLAEEVDFGNQSIAFQMEQQNEHRQVEMGKCVVKVQVSHSRGYKKEELEIG